MPSETAFAPQEGQGEILNAAAESFAARGYCATTLDEIARRLGCTIGRIYHFYSTKMDLFLGVHWKGLDACCRAIKPIHEGGGTSFERLCLMSFEHTVTMIRTLPFQKVVREGIEMHLFGATTPEHRRKMEEVIKTRKTYSHLFRDLMNEAKIAGDLNFEEPGVGIQLLFMSLNSPAFWCDGKNLNEDDVTKKAYQIVTYALTGLGAQSDAIDKIFEGK